MNSFSFDSFRTWSCLNANTNSVIIFRYVDKEGEKRCLEMMWLFKKVSGFTKSSCYPPPKYLEA
jgi:hypothetical protein